MTKEKADNVLEAKSTAPVRQDLSEEIERTLGKQLNEEVKTVRVFGDNYRCNWWVYDRPTHWLESTTGRISKSRFLKVTKAEDGTLLIDDIDQRR